MLKCLEQLKMDVIMDKKTNNMIFVLHLYKFYMHQLLIYVIWNIQLHKIFKILLCYRIMLYIFYISNLELSCYRSSSFEISSQYAYGNPSSINFEFLVNARLNLKVLFSYISIHFTTFQCSLPKQFINILITPIMCAK